MLAPCLTVELNALIGKCDIVDEPLDCEEDDIG